MVLRRILAGAAAGVLAVSLCMPAAAAAQQYSPPFELQSQSVCMMNNQTGEVIFEKGGDEQVNPGYITQLMVAILAIENIEDLAGTELTYTFGLQDVLHQLVATGRKVSTGGLTGGETLTAENLLYAMTLQNACDAAMTLADFLGDGSQAKAVELMNQRARDLGATNTNFTNTTGLYEEGNVTTARDMALLTRHALTLPGFLDYCSVRSKEIGPTNKHSSLLESNYNSIGESGGDYYYAAAQGIKTAGNQPEVGYGLVTTATQDGYTYLLAVLGSPRIDAAGKELDTYLNYAETISLYDWVFQAFTVKTLVEKGTTVDSIPVKLSLKKDVCSLVTSEKFTSLVPTELTEESVKLEPVVEEFLSAPVKKNTEVGYARVLVGGEEIGQVTLVTNESIEMSKSLYYWEKVKSVTSSFWFKFTFIFILLLIVLYVALMIIRNRNHRRYGTGRRTPRRRM